MRAAALLIAAAILAAPGCARRPNTTASSQTLLLVSPAAGYVMPQNQPNIGCAANPVAGYGESARFQWIPVQGAKAYHLAVRRAGSALPWIDATTQGVSYEKKNCNGYVTDANLNGWQWRVEALDSAGRRIASSETRAFRWAPCRLSPGDRPCGVAP